MGLKGKLVSQISIKSDGDVLIELFRDKQHHIPNICPDLIQSVDLLSGQWGSLGSVFVWNFNLDGKTVASKEMMEAIDEKKKSVTYKMIEGGLLELYKTMKFILSVDTSEEDNQLVTLAYEYEKKTEDVPDPCTMMDATVDLIRAVERYQLQVPT
ncbi:hypothetical protein BUALT_BualtUnG0051100 [Buddleja alternifolia]|uniref:Bet v I/Major latex protein domain-containing protein n=1 Tax=Buddleja alternifolia TaxID=168488 RepID=A0AAV6VYW9_9LAMI|nr:hypothetical protein BUALT_BualtUnG0051100 [Buddleja alternifolia]